MLPIYRIYKPKRKLSMAGDKGGDLSHYLERLMKLIPSEVIGLYLVGIGIIPPGDLTLKIVWMIFCLIGLIVLRCQGTKQGNQIQWKLVIISAISFCIWVYSLGGVFEQLQIYEPHVGSLLILAWTFCIPLIYKGDEPAP